MIKHEWKNAEYHKKNKLFYRLLIVFGIITVGLMALFPEGMIGVMGRDFPIAKATQSSVGRHFFESFNQDAIRDKDLFNLEDAREQQRCAISFWSPIAKGPFNRMNNGLHLDSKKVIDQVIFRIDKIRSGTANRCKRNLDFSHGGTS